MSEDRYARLALEVLSRRCRSTGNDLLGDRAATLAHMRRALQSRPRRRVAGGVALAAAAALALLLGALLAAPRPPVARAPVRGASPATSLAVKATGTVVGPGLGLLERQATRRSFARQETLRAGDRLAAGESPLQVSLSTGTQLALAARGELEVVELAGAQRFVLHSGRLHAAVARLTPGQRFLIVTQDSEIEVKGTAFELASESGPNCADGGGTDLRVFEGLVLVRHGGLERNVRAGESWTSRRSAELPPPAPPANVRLAPRSALARQNDLFTAALARHQAGDLGGALRRIEELLRRFPGGPLSDIARAERRKLARELHEPHR